MKSMEAVKRTHRLLASTLALTVLFVMLFSVCFLIAESHHDCTGENCPVCFRIEACLHTLKTLGAAAAAAVTAVFIGLPLLCILSAAGKPIDHTSLVTLKVKLSN